MKTLFNTLLGTALVLCAASSASANQLLVFVTPAQILQLVGPGNIYNSTTICNSGVTNCGVYAVGVIGVAGGTAGQTLGPGAVSAAISPDSTGTDKWVATNIPSSVNSNCSTSGCAAFELSGTANGNSAATFITNNTFANTTKTYTADTDGSSLTGFSVMNATTDSRGIGFLLTFAGTVAAGTTTDVTFELLATKLISTSGQQNGKDYSAQGVIQGLTLVALPEPSSVSMFFGGILAVGAAAWRRRKNLVVPPSATPQS